ncbi:MAG: phosphoglucosamine mutase [Acidimicrobiaceae bacterium]|nr:phosphoglucosamine mutase [Acidimicrobiaceae bacterium]
MLEFGTDGVRGRANEELTPEFALAFGRALAGVFQAKTVVIGRDTRVSGAMLSSALASGLSSSGVAVVDLGVMPTPGVAYISATRAAVGVVISASHNPYQDNGIKVFAPGGMKLEDDLEMQIQSLILSGTFTPLSVEVGEIVLDPNALDEYTSYLLSHCDMSGLRPLKIVVDCSNGAAVSVAPGLFSALNLDVQFIGVTPDGKNINQDCGSVYPELLIKTVLDKHADFGMALDGDADRMLAVDSEGNLVDGDQLMAIFALDLKSRSRLVRDSVAVTVMTNLGFRQAMARNGIQVHETQVGDRYVLKSLEERGLILGGEQSGHIIFRDVATTGDGLLSAVRLVELVSRRSESLGGLAKQSMVKMPQSMVSIEFEDPKRIVNIPGLSDLIARLELTLADSGRILVRPSGTEPKVRIMAEAPTRELADEVVSEIRRYLEQHR